MNEVQGPTPTGTSRPYPSLMAAMRAHRIDPVNYPFIEAIVAANDVTSLIDRGRYIEALRRGGRVPLHIGRTYTNGFAEDDQVTVGGTVLRLQPSEGRAPYFYVTHPSEYPGAPTSRGTRREAAPRVAPAPKPVERDYGVCEVCFMVRTASGGCGCD